MLDQSFYQKADEIIAFYGKKPASLIPIMQDIQGAVSYTHLDVYKRQDSDTTAGILNARSINGDGAGIGGGGYFSCSNITIKSCSVIASSKYGACLLYTSSASTEISFSL